MNDKQCENFRVLNSWVTQILFAFHKWKHLSFPQWKLDVINKNEATIRYEQEDTNSVIIITVRRTEKGQSDDPGRIEPETGPYS